MLDAILLGIDASLTSTGIAVVDFSKRKPRFVAATTIKTEASTPMDERLFSIGLEAARMFDRHRPEAVAIETGIVRHRTTTLLLAQARGAILYALHAAGARNIVDINNSTAKKAVGVGVVGKGLSSHHRKKALKAAIQEGVRERVAGLKGQELTDDEADAIAVCLAARQGR